MLMEAKRDKTMNTIDKFKLDGKVAVITGGAGLLGQQHAKVIAEAGGIPIIWDLHEQKAIDAAQMISDTYDIEALGMAVDITSPEKVSASLEEILSKYDHVDILINNAANDPKVSSDSDLSSQRLENFPLDAWQQDIAVGLTGAYLCSKYIGHQMASSSKGGVILNIASDLGVIAPDQRLYKKEGLEDHEQPVKPVTYSVIKHGIVGLTKYLATYWADNNVRVNAISPGGVFVDQPEDFVKKLSSLIPLGRMAGYDEYMAAILFLVSDASSYMTGSNLIIDGGRTCW